VLYSMYRATNALVGRDNRSVIMMIIMEISHPSCRDHGRLDILLWAQI